MRRFLAGLAALPLLLGSARLAAQTAPSAPPKPPTQSPATGEPPPAPVTAEQPVAPGTAEQPAQAEAAEQPPQPAAPAPKPKGLVEVDVEEEPPVVPPARDTLGGHFVIGASAAFVAPFAELDSDTASNELIGVGPGFGLDLGFGLSRAVLLGASGQYLSYSSSEACPDCSGTSIAAGAFVRYHVVQGVRFDPWISVGIGYRSTSVDLGAGDDANYSGLEWLQLRFGGDWYPLSILGFGPFVELDFGTYLSHDRAPDASDSVYMNMLAGGRIVLDFPGK
jgi:hypothetical protein